MGESARIILALRKRGWNNDDITNFILYVETGDEKYINEFNHDNTNNNDHK